MPRRAAKARLTAAQQIEQTSRRITRPRAPADHSKMQFGGVSQMRDRDAQELLPRTMRRELTDKATARRKRRES